MTARLLCVLGMHRSGTSAVTQYLHRLGATLGPRLLETMAGVNAEGFWEDRCVVDMNQRLLATRGRRWYDWEAVASRDDSVETPLRDEAIGHFARYYAVNDVSVVKDPRLCRLLPFWLDVWSAAAVEPLFVHVARHPFAVAKSLQRRDRIPYEYGVLLWLVYTLEAISHTTASPGVVVVYDRFLLRPQELAETLISRYGVALPATKARWLEAAATIDQHLRHNDNSIETTLGLQEVCTLAVSLFEAIAATPLGDQVDTTQIEQWNAELRQALTRRCDDVAMLSRLGAELMGLSAEMVRIGELHASALTLIQDIRYLRFWRLLPRVMRKVRRT